MYLCGAPRPSPYSRAGILCVGVGVFALDPETSGRPLEQIDDFFSNATSWNVFIASRQIRDQGFADYHWTRKYQGGLEHEQLREREHESTSSGDMDGGILVRLKRRASAAGLI